MRIGWDDNSVNAVEVAKILEDCGMQAIAVHGRTRSQGYGGEANWEVIDAVARAVKIPVIGNGDIHCGADVLRRRAETAVSGVMIGRAAMQNPWVFREAKHFFGNRRGDGRSADRGEMGAHSAALPDGGGKRSLWKRAPDPDRDAGSVDGLLQRVSRSEGAAAETLSGGFRGSGGGFGGV